MPPSFWRGCWALAVPDFSLWLYKEEDVNNEPEGIWVSEIFDVRDTETDSDGLY
jgi:hypothetical protein